MSAVSGSVVSGHIVPRDRCAESVLQRPACLAEGSARAKWWDANASTPRKAKGMVGAVRGDDEP